jgi:hypothetical protein
MVRDRYVDHAEMASHRVDGASAQIATPRAMTV